MWIVLGLGSVLHCAGSLGLRFCIGSFFKTSFNSTLLRISTLDSVNVLDSVFPRFSALDSESALDSIDSKFLRVVFSRILSNFLESCVFSQKGVFPSPQPRKSLRCFCCAALASLWRGKRGEWLFPCLGKNAKNALLHFFNAFLPPRQGRGAVGASAPPY